MDDTFVALHYDEETNFLQHIKAVDPNIQFTKVNYPLRFVC